MCNWVLHFYPYGWELGRPEGPQPHARCRRWDEPCQLAQSDPTGNYICPEPRSMYSAPWELQDEPCSNDPACVLNFLQAHGYNLEELRQQEANMRAANALQQQQQQQQQQPRYQQPHQQ